MPHHQLFRTYREQLRNLRHVWLSSNIQGRGWACDAIGNQPRSNDVMMRRACAWCGASSMTPSICTACSACVQRGEYAFGPTARRGWALAFLDGVRPISTLHGVVFAILGPAQRSTPSGTRRRQCFAPRRSDTTSSHHALSFDSESPLDQRAGIKVGPTERIGLLSGAAAVELAAGADASGAAGAVAVVPAGAAPFLAAAAAPLVGARDIFLALSSVTMMSPCCSAEALSSMVFRASDQVCPAALHAQDGLNS